MTAYWRAQARKQLERSRDANTTLLMGSVRSEASRASAPQPTDTLRPEERSVMFVGAKNPDTGVHFFWGGGGAADLDRSASFV